MGHVRMMAAVQPFLSGAISKTVNLPPDATVEDITNVYLEGWKLGLKAIAVYRDGCKKTPAAQHGGEQERRRGQGSREWRRPCRCRPGAGPRVRPRRKKLPDERRALTHKFSVGGHEGYITVGLYEDGTPARSS